VDGLDDSTFGPADTSGLQDLMSRFASELSADTDAEMDMQIGTQVMTDPGAADAIVARSSLLRAIGALEPSITAGPLWADRQRWVHTGELGEPCTVDANPPDRRQFLPPQPRTDGRGEAKPFHLGLYTSTVTGAGWTMWESYLEPYYGQPGRDSMTYPPPWHSWDLELDGEPLAIAEVVSAKTWVDFVAEWHSQGRDGIVPDWAAVAEHYDAVHISASAVAAAQGLRFATELGTTAPAFWDVESTLWLRWRFSGARLVGIVDPKPVEPSNRPGATSVPDPPLTVPTRTNGKREY
jgi:hypothetical protein